MNGQSLPDIRRDMHVFTATASLPMVLRGLERLSALKIASESAAAGAVEHLWTFAPYGRLSRQLELRPHTAAPEFDNIPIERRESPHWVCWDWWWYQKSVWSRNNEDVRRGPNIEWHCRSAKGPISPLTGETVMWGNGVTTFENAKAFFLDQQVAGIAYCFSEDEPFAGVHFPSCRDARSGVIDPPVRDLLDDLGSYTEISPEGAGVHVIMRDEESIRHFDPRLPLLPNHEGSPHILRYDSFLSITGLA